jgi:hypothetical protein
MLAAIRVEEKALTDPRFSILGKMMGVDKFSARGRMEMLWAHCTETKSYFLKPSVIDTLAESDGFAELICHSEVSLGERIGDVIRIKGAKGRIEWLAKLRKNGKKGGRPRKTKRKPDGFVLETRGEPGANPPTPTLAPTPVSKKTIKNKIFVLPKELEESWAMFWSVQKNKVGRKYAQECFAKVLQSYSIAQVLDAWERYKNDKLKKPTQSWLNPSTFLNNLDEYLDPEYGLAADASPAIDRWGKPVPKPVNQSSLFRESADPRPESKADREKSLEAIQKLKERAGLG